MITLNPSLMAPVGGSTLPLPPATARLVSLLLEWLRENRRRPSSKLVYKGANVGAWAYRMVVRGHSQSVYENYLSQDPIMRAWMEEVRSKSY